RAVRLDLRGAGSGFALARGCYNAGSSDDVRAAAAAVHRLAPQAPLWLAGVSLGGNVVLKLAGEAADRPVANLRRAAAIAPPVDQFVPRTGVPALSLAARDDPFVSIEPIERLRCPPCVAVRLTDCGGHVGYLGADGGGGFCWGERQVVEWLIDGR